ncbi:MAG: hypothetical protein ACLRWP_13410 [Bilophila wadsworthia]
MSVSSLPFLHGALAAVLPKLAAWRRDFHAHPEAGWTEFRTAALIIRRLRELGYAIRMGEAACASDRRMGVPSSAVLAAAQSVRLSMEPMPSWLRAWGRLWGSGRIWIAAPAP